MNKDKFLVNVITITLKDALTGKIIYQETRALGDEPELIPLAALLDEDEYHEYNDKGCVVL